MAVFPTAKDIYIEVEGRRLAAAQSYRVKTTRDARFVESFGSAQPAGTILFTGCQWSGVTEQAPSSDPVCETLTAVAAARLEVSL